MTVKEFQGVPKVTIMGFTKTGEPKPKHVNSMNLQGAFEDHTLACNQILKLAGKAYPEYIDPPQSSLCANCKGDIGNVKGKGENKK